MRMRQVLWVLRDMTRYKSLTIERAISFGGDGHVIEFGPGTLIERDGDVVRVSKSYVSTAVTLDYVVEFPWSRVLRAEPMPKEVPNAAQKRK